MIVLLAMLLGADYVRVRWHMVAGLGFAWAALGMFVLLDSLDNVSLIPVYGLGYLLLIQGVVALGTSVFHVRTARRIRVLKGLGALAIGGLAIERSGIGDVALALLIGVAFACDGALRIAAARVVRFRGWQAAQWVGVLSLVLSLVTLQPWPTWYVGTIGFNVGMAIFLSGVGAMALARRLALLPPGGTMAELLRPEGARPALQPGGPATVIPADAALLVRVWTPAGPASGPQAEAQQNLVERYIAAVDAEGKISTGHAALQAGPVYISHYPADEIEQSPGSFTRVLRATPDNDVAGVFQPSYAQEARDWCPATANVRFRNFDAARLARFWDEYRQDTTYNLTSRNCSSAVAQALDAALEGVLLRPGPRQLWRRVLRAAFSEELWAAHVLRTRAESMAWTPGLVLDYAWALSVASDAPPRRPAAMVRAVLRRRSRAFNARPTSRTG